MGLDRGQSVCCNESNIVLEWFVVRGLVEQSCRQLTVDCAGQFDRPWYNLAVGIVFLGTEVVIQRRFGAGNVDTPLERQTLIRMP
jgi:hypothetical protein